jgi:excisionase family DNA binding protein
MQANNTENKLAFSIKEVAENTSLSSDYIRRKIKSGDLTGSKFGRRVVVLRDDLENWLKRARN